ncbi:crotonase/enoyl-CoA hydratase family protein [Parashewanella spongiae]|uniref:Crotonase/enoyl-CoA hydratase family protein n=1 Tax=Parashewanella spongiae TaxID=342950 RepID=A0A3A6TGG3_9GAMM|nr:crotonase/enoyl-CoA hydratase family protein [Parashewanella spongiae]MCL1079076.1 crotonase/enoyl-CoA hydratase family protein [Parashewanella spongiae]RJY07850.1 crotonase/enoyl-CoA hydratase family protein [Parashewanella spongiae]
MTNKIVDLSIQDGIAFVTLNRAEKHNALNMDMFSAIDNVIKTVSKNKSIRVVIVSGMGESFCSGLDIKSVLSDRKSAIKLLWKWMPGNANLAQRVSVGWRRLNVPVIMALHGKCWGGGLQIALGADFRIASPDCSLSIMEARWGLIPDMGGTVSLTECMSCDQAMKLSMTAEPIDARSALSVGLITEISEKPLESASELAKKLIERSPDTNRTIKKMYQNSWGSNIRRMLAKETWNQLKILVGKNQRITVKRERGDDKAKYKL